MSMRLLFSQESMRKMPMNQLNLTEEMIGAIKEDIQRGLSSKKICMKYHISPVQYAEIKDSMKQKELLLPPDSLDSTILTSPFNIITIPI